MFTLLRILFLILLFAWAICLWQEKRTGNHVWRARRRWVKLGAAALLAIILTGLFVERLLA